MMVKLHLKKNATYYCFLVGRMCETLKDYWTTIETIDGMSDAYYKYDGKANLMKQVAKQEWGNIRLWKKIELDNSDIEIVKP